MKTEELKLVFRPKIRGPVELRPRIVYTDENGKSTSHELERLDLIVRDPGLEGGAVEVRAVLSSQEFVSGETFRATFDIASVGGRPVALHAFENVAPKGLVPISASGGLLEAGERVALKNLKLDPFSTHSLSLVLRAEGGGKLQLAPKIVFKDDTEKIRKEDVPPVEIQVHPASPMLVFLARAFADDYVRKRLSLEQSGWRGLMSVITNLKIPKSQAYGEARYGHTFGRPLETLVRAGMVEYRTYPGKGRGGNVMRVRACYERESVKRLVDRLAGGSTNPSSEPIAVPEKDRTR